LTRKEENVTNARERREALERIMLSPRGVLAVNSKGRVLSEPESDVRTCFQRDVDRIATVNLSGG
jgi:hypothetical protein